eukprot:5722235-Prymnesium_polylepis.1
MHGPKGTAVSLSRSVYHSTVDHPRAHARHGTLALSGLVGSTGHSASVLPSPCSSAAEAA